MVPEDSRWLRKVRTHPKGSGIFYKGLEDLVYICPCFLAGKVFPPWAIRIGGIGVPGRLIAPLDILLRDSFLLGLGDQVGGAQDTPGLIPRRNPYPFLAAPPYGLKPRCSSLLRVRGSVDETSPLLLYLI
jgi:hypothetical protein